VPESIPLKTTVAIIRLTPDEKARWKAYCEQRDVTLSHALREGFALYVGDVKEALAGGDVATT
jgi:hypothetical protein